MGSIKPNIFHFPSVILTPIFAVDRSAGVGLDHHSWWQGFSRSPASRACLLILNVCGCAEMTQGQKGFGKEGQEVEIRMDVSGSNPLGRN